MKLLRPFTWIPIAILLTAAKLSLAESPPLPEWIWAGLEQREGSPTVDFHKEVEIGGEVESATLRVTADFARLAITVNGKLAGELEPYDPPGDFDLRPLLSRGKNRISIAAEGVAGPSAIAASLHLEIKEGEAFTHLTDESWQSTAGKPADVLGTVHEHRWAPNRLPEISPFAEYNQWREATADAAEQLSPLPRGFSIEKVYTAKEGEGSWVSMAIDSSGRIVIGKEQKGILRLALPEEPDGEVKSEVINDTLEECRGLVFQGRTLYANANRSKGLYRLRDSNEDGQFDEVTLLRQTEGSTGHGRNDIEVGPDGNLHAIHGDVVLVPEDSQVNPVHEKGAPKELGHWVSTTLDGNGWQIHCRGLRNPYGIAFNPDGEAFSYDADNEGDVGLPFYRPTRINHLVSGANYGWHQDRGNTRNFPVYAPDTVPTTYDVGRGSPTAVKFGTRSQFPPKYRKALFALDWAYGRIVLTHLVPRGASYYASGEVFLEGRPLNVTDLDFDSRGRLLFITGGRKTQSALFRVGYTGERVSEENPTVQQEARAAWSENARALRRKLEEQHEPLSERALNPIWAYLGDPDPWIRNAARVGVERRDHHTWRELALAASEGSLEELTALLALARQGTEKDEAAAAQTISKFNSKDWNHPEKLTALRIYEIHLNQAQDPAAQLLKRINSQVEPWISSVSDPIRREVIRVLALTGSEEAVPAGLRFMAAASDQLERLHYLEMLSETRAGWTAESRTAFFEALTHARRFSFGDRLMEGFFNTAEINAVAGIADEDERERLVALLEKGKASEPAGELPPPRKEVRAWTLADLSDILDMPLDDRNLERGRKLYDAALCSRCHVAGTIGRPVGPDLTQVASRFSRKDLLEAIIEPSNVVAEVHRNVVIKKNGR